MTEPVSVGEPGLGDYISMLWRRLPLIVAVIVGVTAAAGVVLLAQQKQYTATAGVQIDPTPINPSTGQQSPARDIASTNQFIQTQVQLILGQRVRNLVEKQVGSSAPDATASQVPNANVVNIGVSDTKPTDAVKVADAYANAYILIRQQDQLNGLASTANQVQRQLGNTQALLEGVDKNFAATAAIAGIDAARARWGAEQTTLQDRVTTLSRQLDTLKVAAGAPDSGVKSVGPTKVPTTESSPSKTKTLGLGLAAGLVLGLGLAFVVEYADGSVKDARDLERALPGVPVLAVVPKSKRRGRRRSRRETRRGGPEWVGRRDPAVEQAYDTAAFAIVAREAQGAPTAVVVAAPETQAGVQAVLLASAMTHTSHSVVLVDGSPRGRTLPDDIGPADLGLVGAADGRSRPMPSTLNGSLSILSSGKDPQPQLPARADLTRALDNLRKFADIVVISAEPVLTYGDVMLLGSETSGAVLIARRRKTTRRSLQQSLERLSNVHAELIGVILDEG
jgi:capsular polysaccharide biosynthesis protein